MVRGSGRGKHDDLAQFKGVNPNEQLVEINVRRTVFYPQKPGMNYITVRGFIMRHAATPWAPPTAEQIGLIGAHWSKGWIIENNVISHSICSGISLGKYGDAWDNTSAESAEGYVATIDRALKNGWNKETVGRHIVRNNTISHCEQAGIVGSLGAVFSVIAGNAIHDIHVRQLFTGAEMAGIKIHAAIDVQIDHNHIYRCCRGIWLDWMAQGARISANLFDENQCEDLNIEVNHGPYLVVNNIFLSPVTLLDVSQGGAYVHNLIAGGLRVVPFDGRMTPFHKAHSTELAGMHDNPRGDDRFYNNLFVGPGDLSFYDAASLPAWMDGNVFLKGAKPSKHEKDPLAKPDFDPALNLVEEADGFYLEIHFDQAWAAQRTRKRATTDLLGKAAIPNLPYEQPDGAPLRVNADYFGKQRNKANPTPGPFGKSWEEHPSAQCLAKRGKMTKTDAGSTTNAGKGSTAYLVLVCLVATLGGLLFGYDTGVISGAIEPLTARFHLADFMKGWASGCVLIGCAAGVLAVGPVSDRFGRKLAMFLAAAMFLASAIGTALPHDIWTFIVFRFLGGVGIGIASVSTPMYIAEITPRGFAGGWCPSIRSPSSAASRRRRS